MRSTLLCLSGAVFLILFPTAHARLDESKEQLDTRYGAAEDITGKDERAVLLPGARQFKWKRPTGEVLVTVYRGKSVCEKIQLSNKTTKDADAKVILDANANGSRWTY